MVTVGCAPVNRAKLDGLERTIDAQRRQAERDRKHIDELENRVYVLEDKVETQSISQGGSGQTPRLPVVKKVAPAASAPSADEGAAPSGPAVADRYTDADGDEVLVIYEGDAVKKTPSRPKIALSEGGGRAGAGEWTPADEPAAARTGPRVRRAPAKANAGGAGAKAENPASSDRLPVQKNVPPLPGAESPGPSDAAAVDEADEPLALYKASYQALLRREHAAAIAGFERFLAAWPSHDYADNAQYWLGEAYYDQRDYKTALAEFRKVVKRYPEGNKAPDALLKIGYCYAKLGNDADARDVLTQVVEIYPKTEAAKLAARRLDELRPSSQGATP